VVPQRSGRAPRVTPSSARRGCPGVSQPPLFANSPASSQDRASIEIDEGSARRAQPHRAADRGARRPDLSRLRSATTTGRQRRDARRQAIERGNAAIAALKPQPSAKPCGNRLASSSSIHRLVDTALANIVGVSVPHAGGRHARLRRPARSVTRSTLHAAQVRS